MLPCSIRAGLDVNRISHQQRNDMVMRGSAVTVAPSSVRSQWPALQQAVLHSLYSMPLLPALIWASWLMW